MLPVMRALARRTLRTWGRAAVAPGWHYQVVDRWGGHLAEAHPLPHRLVNGCVILSDLSDLTQRLSYFVGAYEPVVTFLLSRLLRPGMTVVDGGAHVGEHTLLAATCVGAAGSVHSFEPVPTTFARLADHVARNGLTNVTANRMALWNEAATLRLTLPPDCRGNTGMFSVGFGRTGGTVIESPSIRLDDYAATRRVRRVDLVKLDVEGAERRALEGMKGILDRDQPMLIIEVNRETANRMGYTPRDLSALLMDDLGYQAWAIGWSSATSGPLRTLENVDQQNVLFHHGLPAQLTAPWDLKAIIRWLARGDAARPLDTP